MATEPAAPADVCSAVFEGVLWRVARELRNNGAEESENERWLFIVYRSR